jgi:hypothetical protein
MASAIARSPGGASTAAAARPTAPATACTLPGTGRASTFTTCPAGWRTGLAFSSTTSTGALLARGAARAPAPPHCRHCQLWLARPPGSRHPPFPPSPAYPIHPTHPLRPQVQPLVPQVFDAGLGRAHREPLVSSLGSATIALIAVLAGATTGPGLLTEHSCLRYAAAAAQGGQPVLSATVQLAQRRQCGLAAGLAK